MRSQPERNLRKPDNRTIGRRACRKGLSSQCAHPAAACLLGPSSFNQPARPQVEELQEVQGTKAPLLTELLSVVIESIRINCFIIYILLMTPVGLLPKSKSLGVGISFLSKGQLARLPVQSAFEAQFPFPSCISEIGLSLMNNLVLTTVKQCSSLREELENHFPLLVLQVHFSSS